jgi:hypothetical protein
MTLDLRFYRFDTYNVPARRSTGAFPDHVEVHSALRRHAAGVGALVRGRGADKGYSRPPSLRPAGVQAGRTPGGIRGWGARCSQMRPPCGHDARHPGTNAGWYAGCIDIGWRHR